MDWVLKLAWETAFLSWASTLLGHAAFVVPDMLICMTYPLLYSGACCLCPGCAAFTPHVTLQTGHAACQAGIQCIPVACQAGIQCIRVPELPSFRLYTQCCNTGLHAAVYAGTHTAVCCVSLYHTGSAALCDLWQWQSRHWCAITMCTCGVFAENVGWLVECLLLQQVWNSARDSGSCVQGGWVVVLFEWSS